MVFSTDLRKAVESIISPEVPMALRLTSNLLLGVVRILHRKSKYLLQESTEAMTRLKLAFRSGANTDLPQRATTTAAYNAITIQPSVDTLNAPNLDLDLLPARTAPNHTSFLAADRDITIDEFAGGLVGGMLDAFALEPELDRQDEMDADLGEPLLFTPSQRTGRTTPVTPSVRSDPSVQSAPSAERMRADSDRGPLQDETPVLSGGSRDAPSINPEGESPGQAVPPTPGLTTRDIADEPEAARRAAVDGVPIIPDLTDITPKPDQPAAGTPAVLAIPADIEGDTPLALPHLPEDSPGTPLILARSDSAARESPSDQPPQMPRLSTGADDLVLAEPATGPPAAEEVDSVRLEGVSGAAYADDVDAPATEKMMADEARQSATPPTGSMDESAPIPHGEPNDQIMEEGLETPQQRRESAGWRPPATPETPETPISQATQVIRERKRKASVLNDEGATELSASAFRAWLNDTSDLLRGPRAPTRRRIVVSTRYADVIGKPVMRLAPLNALYAQSFRYVDLVASPISDADLVESERTERRDDERPVLENEQQEEQMVVMEETPVKFGVDTTPSQADVAETPGEPSIMEASPEPLAIDAMDVVMPMINEDDNIAVGSTSVAVHGSTEGVPEAKELDETNVEVMPEGDATGIVETHEAKEVEEAAIGGPDAPSEVQVSSRDMVGREVSDVATGTEGGPIRSGIDEADSGKMVLSEVAKTRAQVDGAVSANVTEATVSARTRKMREYIIEHMTDGELNFSNRLGLEDGVSKRVASRTFYELLNLSNKKAVVLQQRGVFGDILARPSEPEFESLEQEVGLTV